MQTDFAGGQELDSDIFVSASLKVLWPIYQLCKDRHSAKNILATAVISPALVFEEESKVWLKAISHRLVGRRSIKYPFCGQISRDIPYELFCILVRLVKEAPDYTEPFCCYGNNKKGEVISVTSMRLVVDLLSQLSRLTAKEVVTYFKRDVRSGSRNGHRTAVICSPILPLCTN